MGRNTFKPGLCSFFFWFVGILFMEVVMAQHTTTPVNVGVVLYDFENWVGKMWLSCINISLSDFYATHAHYKTRMLLNTRNSMADVFGAAAAGLDLIKNAEVQAILGPVTSMQANFVVELGKKAQVPIISFSASSPFLTSIKSPYFFQATQNDKSQVKAICAIIQAFGWREAVPIYVDNLYGVGFIPYLMEALQAVDTRVPYQSAISPSANDDQIVRELYKLMTMQTRVFIVHIFPSLGARLFIKAKEIGMMSEGYVWIMTDGMTNLLSSLDPSAIDSMQGALGVQPYVARTKELEKFRVRWKKKFHQYHPDMVDAELNIYGLWAYDATMALAMAIEEAGTTNFGFQRANISSNSTDLETLKVSENGPNLARALANISFKGLTGDFLFVNNKLPSSAFEIVNLNGVGPKGIGFWTPDKGLVKKFKSPRNASSKANLAPIIWPGDSISVPKGWEIPTNGTRLRIGVPVKKGFTEFVNVTKDPITKVTKVTGYCMDVFDAVMKELPYAVAYDYIPYAFPNGSSAGTYNDLVYQVHLGNFDAAVGDVTIIANRSLYVDYTLPYTEADVLMLVRVQDEKINNAMIFLKPLSWELWVTTLCFFLFIGFVVWILEHRINDDFQGPPLHQAGTSLWFAFSTMVFAHREKVFNNWARLVVIIWSFALLILTQSYTASFASLLTVQRLQPSVTYVNELIQNGESVGCPTGSFVYGILKKLGFQDNQLLSYNSPEEVDKLFSEGTGNHGIVAAFDESPYMKLIQARSCSNYTTVEPSTFMLKTPSRNFQQFKTDGFGFVFPRGSPLVPDVSRAILKVTEDDEMRRIENAWFGGESKCPDSSKSVSSSILGIDSFWGLFLIVGVISVSALVTYTAMFVHEHWEILKDSNSRASIWSRILHLLRIFNKPDPKAHALSKGKVDERSGINAPGDGAPNARMVRSKQSPVESKEHPLHSRSMPTLMGQELKGLP
ncbi:hypothetical protein P3X46_011320 [Hevea brasiliensis]|uniref:Glutamate receptor n=1 Tax=Hevea brasiliensis TaxID=3981 RepID=A0ABQ9MKX4_HEVBR|nr:hypothetical protein P3X46_011320 [Hevea brasiliensis]